MEAKKLYAALHAESRTAMELRAKAEAHLALMDSTHTAAMERILVGASMLHGFNWTLSVQRYAFAAPYRTCGYFVGLTYTLSIGTVDSWGALEPLFNSLDAAGISPDKWESSDQAASYTRKYEAVLHRDSPSEENPEGELIVQILAQLPGDTDTCRRVVVGYTEPSQIAPEPIYKLECNGESTDESEAQRSSDDQPL